MQYLKFYVSSDINTLTHQFSEDVKLDINSIFDTANIITQNQGMNSWLEMNLATTLGIAINYKFRNTLSLITEIYRTFNGDSKLIISKNQLIWLIFDILSTAEFSNKFPNIEAYYHNNEGKRAELANKVGDLLDQYQSHRGNLIRKWNQIQNDDDFDKPYFKYQGLAVKWLAHENWQAYLWKTIKERLGSAYKDMTEVQDFIYLSLQNDKKIADLKSDFPQIYLFGIQSFTEFQVDILYQLANIIPVNLYLINHAPLVYWVEDRSEKEILRFMNKYGKELNVVTGNSLLTNWGRMMQGTFAMFYKNEFVINNQILLDEYAHTEYKPTLLGAIQETINNNEVDLIHFTKDQILDHSIQIAANYSVYREVEALYNYLVATIAEHNLDEQKDKLTVRDILVVVNDMDLYTPYIKAVFDNAPHRFHYTIADESISKGNNIIAAAISLLELDYDTITAENILQILENPYIRNSFEIQNLDFIKTAMQAASIRFGFDNKLVDDTFLVSINNGIKRLMYGICIEGEPLIDQLIPTDFTDATQDFVQLTNLSKFIQKLETSLLERKKSRNLKEWKTEIENMLQTFIIDEDDEKNEDYWSILNNFNQIEMIDDKMKNCLISFNVIRMQLLLALDNEISANKFLNTGITFCSPIPFRSIPFKIVAVLGLNFDNFPRKDQSSEFDLIKNNPTYNDRSLKNNDKHLFLESVMSAKEKLYLSYIGSSVKDNATLAPSILLDELISYIQAGVTEDIDINQALITRHPLQGFSKKYNINPLLKNYILIDDQHKFQVATTDEPSKNATFPVKIDIKHIVTFCQNSIEYYFKHVIGIYEQDQIETIPENEVFELEFLENWNIKNEKILSAAINPNYDFEKEIEKEYLKGKLPLKNYKNLYIKNLNKESENSIAYLKNQILNPESLKSVQINDLKINRFNIVGELQYIDNKECIVVLSASKDSSKNKIKAWIYYLIAVASDKAQDFKYILYNNYYENKEVITKEEATDILKNILEVMESAHQQMIPFFPAYYEKDNLALSKAVEKQVNNFQYQDFYLHLAVDLNLINYENEDVLVKLKSLLTDRINQLFVAK